MFFGEHKHNIDKKGRIAIPSKYRDELGTTFMIAKSITGHNCLCVYSNAEWKVLAEKIQTLPTVQADRVKRFLYAGACDVEFDSQGRILIPSNLREFAKLEGETAVVGMLDHIEIWNMSDYAAESSVDTAQSIADLVGNLNI